MNAGQRVAGHITNRDLGRVDFTDTPAEAVRDFTQSAIAHPGTRADNATALIADLA